MVHGPARVRGNRSILPTALTGSNLVGQGTADRVRPADRNDHDSLVHRQRAHPWDPMLRIPRYPSCLDGKAAPEYRMQADVEAVVSRR